MLKFYFIYIWQATHVTFQTHDVAFGLINGMEPRRKPGSVCMRYGEVNSVKNTTIKYD